MSPPARSNARVAILCVAVFLGMVGAAYASVPLYRAFCQLTGFGGTVSKAEAAPTKILDQTLTVRFDANVRNIPWDFKPNQVSQTVRIGETGLAFFKVTNNSDKPVTGRATYNVLPEAAGAHFQKLECFCFTEQTVQPGETMEFPMVYFIDPAFASDPETKGEPEVTLSYTFFPVEDEAKTTASALGDKVAGRL
ncbi:MAG TPA: cytochrome c oxidase assembly protein [Caulobacteraceae bacterium]|nr:cytochrome c oxidase assembly protein [Caulobacteraceae bacterium]